MMTQHAERILPYTAQQLFDLAADVESYPEYLPGWISARIRKRAQNEYYTDQVLGLGPIRVAFGSRTILQRPRRIDVMSTDSPFRQFKLSWTFEPGQGSTCKASVFAGFEFRSTIFQRICERILPNTITDVMAAFERRATRLYARTDQPA